MIRPDKPLFSVFYRVFCAAEVPTPRQRGEIAVPPIPTIRPRLMKLSPPLWALLLVAAASLGACSSSEMTSINTPQWIDQNPNLQFDFTVPYYNNPIYLGIKVNVSFDGFARFYLLRSDEPYTRIASTSLTFEERAYLASLFDEAGFATFPEIVPASGQVSTPPSTVQMSYRAQRGRDHRTVYGAVSKKRNEAAYPDGFFDLLDGLAVFVSDKLNASTSHSHVGLHRPRDRRVAATRR